VSTNGEYKNLNEKGYIAKLIKAIYLYEKPFSVNCKIIE